MRNTPVGKSILFLALAAALGSGAAFARDYSDEAPVISSTPIYERVSEPTQQCWNETVTTQEYVGRPEHNVGGAIVGGIVGGVLGHQVGSGHGRDAATAGGAAVGALAGSQVGREGGYAPVERTVQRCRTADNYHDQIRGYDVVYRYNGRNIHTRLPYDPGPTVRVDVTMAR